MITARGLLLNRGRSPAVSFPGKQYFYIANGFRPRPRATETKACPSIRQASFEAGENESGHISTGRNEGIFFFDSRLLDDPMHVEV